MFYTVTVEMRFSRVLLPFSKMLGRCQVEKKKKMEKKKGKRK